MNILQKWCNDNDRPFKYLAEQAGIPYHTLNRHKGKTNKELKKSLTYSKVQRLKKVIPNIEDKLNEA